MDPNIRFLYKTFYGKYSSTYTFGVGLYEADHWANEKIPEALRPYNKFRKFVTNLARSDYEKYSKKRCSDMYNLKYCPICDLFTGKISKLKKLNFTKNDPIKIDQYAKSLKVILELNK